MTLLIYYIGLVFAGDLIAVAVCLGIEKVWPTASLPIFIAMYFFVLWLAWVLAVRLTAQQGQPTGAAASPPR